MNGSVNCLNAKWFVYLWTAFALNVLSAFVLSYVSCDRHAIYNSSIKRKSFFSILCSYRLYFSAL